MNKEDIHRFATKLEQSGVRFATLKGDGKGNLSHVEELPWFQAIPMIMSRTGWTIVEQDEEDTTTLTLISD